MVTWLCAYVIVCVYIYKGAELGVQLQKVKIKQCSLNLLKTFFIILVKYLNRITAYLNCLT